MTIQISLKDQEHNWIYHLEGNERFKIQMNIVWSESLWLIYKTKKFVQFRTQTSLLGQNEYLYKVWRGISTLLAVYWE